VLGFDRVLSLTARSMMCQWLPQIVQRIIQTRHAVADGIRWSSGRIAKVDRGRNLKQQVHGGWCCAAERPATTRRRVFNLGLRSGVHKRVIIGFVE